MRRVDDFCANFILLNTSFNFSVCGFGTREFHVVYKTMCKTKYCIEFTVGGGLNSSHIQSK